jgi:hypothetical protein
LSICKRDGAMLETPPQPASNASAAREKIIGIDGVVTAFGPIGFA